MKTEISKEVLDLLLELNIKLPAELRQSRTPCQHTGTPKPSTIDLSLKSGEVSRKCCCCGQTTKTFVDYVKRDGCDGYMMRTVVQPSHPITRYHEYNVIKCSNCSNLEEKSQSELIEMINNLRDKIYSNKGAF